MKHEMTGKERMMAALKGEPVDRVPIWLREGFPIAQPFPKADDFTRGWQWEETYQDLFRHVSPHADVIRSWGLGGWSNRFLMVPPNRIQTKETMVTPDVKRIEGIIDTPRGKLTFVNEQRKGFQTAWHVKPLVESVQDLKKLAEVPFEFDPLDIEPFVGEQHRVYKEVGDRGVLRLGLSSPMVAISGCMKLEMFLEMSVTQKALYHELLGEITRRNLLLIDAVFKDRSLDTTVNLGGSEQCTPPLMTPRAFDEFVVPYDGQLVRRLKEYGVLVNCHCHGKIRHALRCMVEMGLDSTDPVEPPPAGDVTFAQAREIADDKITLIGNLEFDELCFSEPSHIRKRVKEILEQGKDRLILGSSAGPVSAVTPQLADNYRAWIETALE
jgi:uroporphyrinogen-III decarboxylase